MNKKQLFKNLRLPDPDSMRVKVVDLLYTPGDKKEQGRILKIAEHIEDAEAVTTQFEGEYLLPAFFDIGASFGFPGYEHRETLETGSLAALWGGYGDVLISPETKPFTDNEEIITKIAKRARETAQCRIHRCAALTLGGRGNEICDYNALWNSGAIAFSDGDEPKFDFKTLREAMKNAARQDLLIILCPKRFPEYKNSAATEGRAADLLGVESEPACLEARSISEYLILAEETGCRIHIRGISTEQSIKLIKRAKAEGTRVSCSTSPWYFSLCSDDTVFIGPNAKVYPPLRSPSDRAAVIEALKNGIIDCIDSGHTPRSRAEKGKSFCDAMFGAIGIQSCFSCAVTYLLRPGYIDIFRLTELLSYNPARICGFEKERAVNEKSTAFCIVSPSDEFIVTNSFLKSRCVNCPFVGMSLCGTVLKTVIL